jgi:hypothetical protein
MDAGNGTAAKEYLAEHRSEIDADNVSALDASTKKASVDEAAEALAVQAFAASKKPDEQFAAIDKSKAPIEVKDAARTRLKSRIAVGQAQKDYDKDQAEQSASARAALGEEPTPSEVALLGAHKAATYRKIAEDYRKRKVNPDWKKEIPPKTIRDAKAEIDEMWDNGKLAQMSAAEFRAKFNSKLPDAEYDRAFNDWRAARKEARAATSKAEAAQAKKEEKWAGEYSQANMINSYMRDKMRWKPGNPKRVAYREAVSDELREMTEANNGKALTTDQVNKLLTRMAIEIDTPGWGRTPVYERPKIEGVPQSLVDDYAAALQAAIKDPNSQYYKKDLTPELIQQFHLAVEYARNPY